MKLPSVRSGSPRLLVGGAWGSGTELVVAGVDLVDVLGGRVSLLQLQVG